MLPNVPERPIANSYWVIPGKLLAGEYPSSLYDGLARQMIRVLLDCGIDYFLDLTEEGEGRSQILYVPISRKQRID